MIPNQNENQFIRPGGPAPVVQPAQPSNGIPTWMDAYNHFTSTDQNFKNLQKDYGGQIDRQWNSDDGTKQLKSALDADYIRNLAEYNTKNGTNYQPDPKMLGVDAQPNDWNHKRNPHGWSEQNLGIGGNQLALLAAGIATGGFGLLGGELAGGGLAGMDVAGAMGLEGAAATAANAGLLSGGMSLARGNNIGDSLKAGLTGAALSPVAGFASNAVGGGITGNIVGNAASGGAGSLLRGGNVWNGIRDGAVNGAVSSAGQFAGNMAGTAASDLGKTGSQFVGQFANTATQQALRGRQVDPSQIVQNQLFNYGKNSLFRG